MGRAFATVLVCLASLQAHAVLAPEAYEAARRKAAFNVQVRLAKMVMPLRTPGECRVEGIVVRIFRNAAGPTALRPGTRIRFDVACRRRGDRLPASARLYLDASSLRPGVYLESFLNTAGKKGFEAARDQHRVIDAPTESSTFGGRPSGLENRIR